MRDAIPSAKREIAWWTLIIHLPIMALLVAAFYFLLGVRPAPIVIALGAGLFLVWSRLSKAYALRFHRRGLQLMLDGDYSDAVREFSSSFQWLGAHDWIDRHRALFLLESSARGYREMALVNKAAGLYLSGAVTDSQQAYIRALELFPDSALARSGILECQKVIEGQGRGGESSPEPIE